MSGGKRSRDKGARRERELVHYLQGCEIPAKRVPLSGAARGFKADVIATVDGVEYKIEVKSRAKDYDRIYELFDSIEENDEVGFTAEHQFVFISLDFKQAVGNSFIFTPVSRFNLAKKFARTVNKILRMRELLGEADLLAIKADRKPWLFIVYRR